MGLFNKLCYLGGGAIVIIGVSGIFSNPPPAPPPTEEPIVETGGAANPGQTNNSTTGNGTTGNGTFSANGTGTTGNGTLSSAITDRVGESTYNVPDTQNGNVACAYVVNDVYRTQTGQTITNGNGSNLSVIDTVHAMRASPDRFMAVDQATAVASGQDYIIASNPEFGSTGSHIGIGNGSTVWSNSSSRAVIRENSYNWEGTFGATQYYIVR